MTFKKWYEISKEQCRQRGWEDEFNKISKEDHYKEYKKKTDVMEYYHELISKWLIGNKR